MGEPFERLKEAVADRYALERELGRGGMATVYLAMDLRHHRKVAVKVLQAIDQIEIAMQVPNILNPAMLKVDPIWDPLRKLPRFQELVSGK